MKCPPYVLLLLLVRSFSLSCLVVFLLLLSQGVSAIGRRVALYSPYMAVWYVGLVVYCDEQGDSSPPSSSSNSNSNSSNSSNSNSNSSSKGGYRPGRYLVAYDDGDCAWAHLEGMTDILLFHMATEDRQL